MSVELKQSFLCNICGLLFRGTRWHTSAGWWSHKEEAEGHGSRVHSWFSWCQSDRSRRCWHGEPSRCPLSMTLLKRKTREGVKRNPLLWLPGRSKELAMHRKIRFPRRPLQIPRKEKLKAHRRGAWWVPWKLLVRLQRWERLHGLWLQCLGCTWGCWGMKHHNLLLGESWRHAVFS